MIFALLLPLVCTGFILIKAAHPRSHTIPLAKVLLVVLIMGVISLRAIPYLTHSESSHCASGNIFDDTCKLERVLTGYWAGESFQDYYGAGSFQFDHPEPNFVIVPHIAEFWSALTTIPFSGVMLLWVALSQGYDLPLIALYSHVTIMYIGACISHTSLIGNVFSFTVCAVIANSLQAFFWWSFLLGGPFNLNIVSWTGLCVGLFVGVYGVLTIQELECFKPVGGFITLSIVQPPFVFLGLISAYYLHYKNKNDQGYKYLFIGGSLLMSAMGLSVIETFVNPFLLGTVSSKLESSSDSGNIIVSHEITGLGGFPLLHVLIHITEQLGIFFYGTGAAWVHLKYVVKRDDVYISDDFIFSVKIRRGESDNPITYLRDISGSETQDFMLDLNSPEWRKHPGALNFLLSRSYLSGICPIVGESSCHAVCNPEDIRRILKDPLNFSSNPFPDNRLIGLSTTCGKQHDTQRKLVGKFFSRKILQQMEKGNNAYSRIAEAYTSEFADCGGGDMVKFWGYRIAVASGLVALGVPVEDILNSSPDVPKFLCGTETIDQMGAWSRDAVKLMAPIGGMGPRIGVTLPQFLSFLYNVGVSIPRVIHLILVIGPKEAWKILRPDLLLRGQLFPYFSKDFSCPRTGVFIFSSSIPQIPSYIIAVRDMWIHYSEIYPSSMFGTIMEAKRNKIVSEAEGLMLIVQCLVSMTTANAILNAVIYLTDPTKHNMLCENFSIVDWRRDLSTEPTYDQIEHYVEEFLINMPSLQRLPRRVVGNDVNLNGTPLNVGDQLIMMIGAANQELIEKCPAVSLTFGTGTHKCLGEELVKLEVREALMAWIKLIGLDSVECCEYVRITNVDVGNYGFEKYEVRLE